MSGTEDRRKNQLPAEYKVGYSKPPVEHRFKKGQSGNPRGRPKGSRNQKIDDGFGMRAAQEYLKEEAYRPVTIREGDALIELPAIQAVFRAMGVSAMKGNRFAQRTMAELVTAVEAQDHESRMELFGTAIDYKVEWDKEFEHCRTAGLPEPEPLPHPDDIVLDMNTGGVKIQGPQTPEQKKHYDISIARRDEAQQEVSYFAEQYRKSRSEKRKAQWLSEWHHEQRIFDTINDLLGPRYQVKLKDRSYADSASRAGDYARKYGIAR